MGLMVPSHRSESCLQVNDDTFYLTLTDEPSSKLEKGNDGEFTTSISTVSNDESTQHRDLGIYDIKSNTLEGDDWCTSY